MDEVQEMLEDQIEIYIVVMCGTRIGFFEYHNDQSNLDSERIPHYRGCISVTDTYRISGILTPGILNPRSLRLGRLDYGRTSRLRNQARIQMRNEAEEYQMPCIFDATRHINEIDAIFRHMASNPPRSSI